MTSSRYASSGITSPDATVLLLGGLPPGPAAASYHPPAGHIFKLWQIFLDKVNPLTKIVHAPTLQQKILEVIGDLDNVSQGLEALMFAIYTIAVTSISDSDCETMFGEERLTLLTRYRSATQRALIAANFIMTPDLVVLQAFVLYMVGITRVARNTLFW